MDTSLRRTNAFRSADHHSSPGDTDDGGPTDAAQEVPADDPDTTEVDGTAWTPPAPTRSQRRDT